MPDRRVSINQEIMELDHEGTACIEIGDERNSAGKDTLVESPKEAPHASENYSNEDILRVMVVKAPRP